MNFKCSFLEHNKSSSLVYIFDASKDDTFDDSGKSFIKELNKNNASFIRKHVTINEENK